MPEADNTRYVNSGPFDWCPRCRGFGIYSKSISLETAVLVLCDCRNRTEDVSE